MTKPTLRIAMLNAEIPVPTITPRYPTFGRIFHSLLSSASHPIHIESTDFNVLSEAYPPSIDAFDALIISGSAASAYDNLPWIHRLSEFLIDVYQNHPKVKIFGACFGHQIICQALLGRYGAKVELDPSGWEIGIRSVSLEPEFQHVLGVKCGVMRMQFLHADHVVLPEELPHTWMSVGKTEHCGVQGVYGEGRVLTLQGHFEFDRWINRETVECLFRGVWEEEFIEDVLERIEGDDDAVSVAGMVVGFLAGGGGRGDVGSEEDVGLEFDY